MAKVGTFWGLRSPNWCMASTKWTIDESKPNFLNLDNVFISKTLNNWLKTTIETSFTNVFIRQNTHDALNFGLKTLKTFLVP